MLSSYNYILEDRTVQQIEQKLDELLVKKAPFQIPEDARKMIVQIAPWLTLVGGVLSLLAVSGLYNAATFVNNLNMAVYGVAPYAATYMPLVWLSLLLVLVEAVLYFIAFPALRLQKKSGWNLLYWVALVNVAVAVLYVFYDQNILGLLMSLIGSLIGMYILFQIRSYYTPAGVTPVARPASTTPPPAPKVEAGKKE